MTYLYFPLITIVHINQIFLIPSPVNRHLRWFYNTDIVENITINIDVEESLEYTDLEFLKRL